MTLKAKELVISKRNQLTRKQMYERILSHCDNKKVKIEHVESVYNAIIDTMLQELEINETFTLPTIGEITIKLRQGYDRVDTLHGTRNKIFIRERYNPYFRFFSTFRDSINNDFTRKNKKTKVTKDTRAIRLIKEKEKQKEKLKYQDKDAVCELITKKIVQKRMENLEKKDET